MVSAPASPRPETEGRADRPAYTDARLRPRRKDTAVLHGLRPLRPPLPRRGVHGPGVGPARASPRPWPREPEKGGLEVPAPGGSGDRRRPPARFWACNHREGRSLPPTVVEDGTARGPAPGGLWPRPSAGAAPPLGSRCRRAAAESGDLPGAEAAASRSRWGAP
ncbi:putative HTLV-1-related endogenous sequence [Vulpes lagopus]|uniref:putative HTLV-1-related endogenous sequence n=1 Tax=Vulpes lagopus TaxID=494514 RepID=UPI001BC921ED|nr:putative HTLV-1-related endogenous sequence [Vulpes lagopus]